MIRMKKLLILIILASSYNCFSQTQAEMNKEAYADFQKSNNQLNEIYQTILSEYESDSIFVNNLKKSQRIWIQFRDSEMELKYPNYNDDFYGSIHPTCRAVYLQELTDSRIETLKKWVCGTEEGDVCSGSVKIKNDTLTKVLCRKKIESNYWFDAEYDGIKLIEIGKANPAEFIEKSLRKKTELIPLKAVLGGTMNFGYIQILSSEWLIAEFDDGHIRGRGIYKYTLNKNGELEFKLLNSIGPE